MAEDEGSDDKGSASSAAPRIPPEDRSAPGWSAVPPAAPPPPPADPWNPMPGHAPPPPPPQYGQQPRPFPPGYGYDRAPYGPEQQWGQYGQQANQQAPYYPQSGYPYPQQAYGQQYYGYQPNQSTNGLAIASLILSAVGLLLFGVPGLVGLVLGIVSIRQIGSSRGAQRGRGLAVAGIVVGSVVVVIWILALIGFLSHPQCGGFRQPAC